MKTGIIQTTLMLIVLGATQAALALPQFAVRSARACDTCHVEPTGWTDPAVSERKCSLNCNTCHVSPSGGGMRTESGLFYGRHTLPLWNRLAPDQLNLVKRSKEVPASQPTHPSSQRVVPSSQPTSMAATSQPTSMGATSQPTSMGAASQPTSMGATSQPTSMGATSQPTSMGATSQPLSAGTADAAHWPSHVPAPGTAARFAGIEPHPTFQIGGDLRLALFAPVSDESESEMAVFPMQTDLYLAYRPYNPKDYNRGRVTLLASLGASGSKTEEFDGFTDRFFVREWYAMYHDLPNQMYARAGRFLPAHGWKTDDHTGFVRQGQLLLGQPFDHERQVTGVEVGLNPNYPYLHASIFNMADNWDEPIDNDMGYGAALSTGYRDLGWQAGTSVVYGTREKLGATPTWDQLALSLQWAANLHVLTQFLPLTYLGEYHIMRTVVDGADATIGLAAFHELGYLVMQGLNVTTRYDWSDANTDFRYDSRHRINLGLEWYPVPFLEVIARYRHNWQHTDDRFSAKSDEFLFMLHGWY